MYKKDGDWNRRRFIRHRVWEALLVLVESCAQAASDKSSYERTLLKHDHVCVVHTEAQSISKFPRPIAH